MAEITLDDIGDDIVWQYGRYKCENGQIVFRSDVLTKASYDALLAHFGETWLCQYLLDAKHEIDTWASQE